jgi:hypothetical protein
MFHLMQYSKNNFFLPHFSRFMKDFFVVVNERKIVRNNLIGELCRKSFSLDHQFL